MDYFYPSKEYIFVGFVMMNAKPSEASLLSELRLIEFWTSLFSWTFGWDFGWDCICDNNFYFI